MATTRKTTAARKTAASKTTKPATEPVEEPKIEEALAEATAPDSADEAAADSPSAEGAPTSDEAAATRPDVRRPSTPEEIAGAIDYLASPAAGFVTDSATDGQAGDEAEASATAEEEAVDESGAEPELTDAEKATNAAEIAGRHAIAESGNVPGVATTPIRVDSVDLQHAPLNAPKPKAEEPPAQPAAAETQFGDIAAVHLKTRPDADVIDEATGEAPVPPLFSEPVFGIVTSRYRLLETGILNGRVVKRLLVPQHMQMSEHAAAKIEAHVAELNADLDEA